MAYGPDSERGKWGDPLQYVNMQNIDIVELKENLTLWCKNNSIPATMIITEYVSGSFFSKTRTPLLIISNPQPECRYFSLGIYATQNVLSFPLFGESAENTKANKYEYYKTQGTGLKATFYKPDMLKLQQEALWQQSIADFFNE